MEKSEGRVKFVNIIAGLLLAIVSMYYSSATMFYHVHTIDGVEIVHSHFHGMEHASTPDDGAHSSNELSLIEHLNDIVIIQGENITISELYTEREYQNFVSTPLEPTLELYAHDRSSRAPPRYYI